MAAKKKARASRKVKPLKAKRVSGKHAKSVKGGSVNFGRYKLIQSYPVEP